MRNICRMLISSAICCLAIVFLATIANAQPSDAELKKQLTSARTVAVTLGKPGKIEWSTTYKKYVWTRNFTSKLKTDDPTVFLLVKGYASYDVMAGRYVFWRTFTTSNSYDGIPDITAEDVQALITKFGVKAFMGEYQYNHVIGQVESLKLADEPKYEWHTPNSVSLNVVGVYTLRTNDIGGKERGARTFRIRFYRDNTKSEWKNLLVTSDSEWKVL